MHITKFTHSCLRVEGPGVLVVDPGAWSEPGVLDGADAVLITHEHIDHVDPAALAAAVRKRPQMRVFAHADVLATFDDPALSDSGLGEVASAVEPGAAFEAAGLRVRAFGGQHAVIHPDIPRIANLGFLIADDATNLYHPGDSFTVPEDTAVDTLFVPLNAPWMKLMEAVDFLRAVAPGRAYALHDALLTPTGAGISDGHLDRLGGSRYAHVSPGTILD